MLETLLTPERTGFRDEASLMGRVIRRGARWAPGVVPPGLAAVLWVHYDTPDVDVVRYVVAFVASVLLPGVLVHRWLRGRPTLLISDLSLGAATGLALQLLYGDMAEMVCEGQRAVPNRAQALGVNAYLGKPYQEVELMRNVFDLLGVEPAGVGSGS